MRLPVNTPPIRCAIYTRKSTDEGLESDFNSLDAQREAAEAYIASQTEANWKTIAKRYDDGGYTGGNLDRPALKLLMADIESGEVDCVVVYKVDRISRSLMDFAKLLELFERKKVSFVSVTQQFNTSNPMGRLVLNILFSFAQFERELISERTRDKMSASRRKGKWCGGLAPLGYDIAPEGRRIIVNPDESRRVQMIFELYLDIGTISQTVAELDRRDWTNKRSTTRSGKERGGRKFDKSSLFKLLTNIVYIGKTRHKGEAFDGEHQAIITKELWDRVQKKLKQNGLSGGVMNRNKHGALLRGILRCVGCDAAMSPNHTTKGKKRYRYYICTSAQKKGWSTCESKSIPAQQIEDFVVEQIRSAQYPPELLTKSLQSLSGKNEHRLAMLEEELRLLGRDTNRWNSELYRLTPELQSTRHESQAVARLADLQDRIRLNERRATAITEEVEALNIQLKKNLDSEGQGSPTTTLWESMTTRDQLRLIQAVIKRIDYDGASGRVTIIFNPVDSTSSSEATTKDFSEL